MVRSLSGWVGALPRHGARSIAADAGAADSFSSATTALATCCGALNCAGGRWVSCWTTVTLVVPGNVSRAEALAARSTLAAMASKPGAVAVGGTLLSGDDAWSVTPACEVAACECAVAG